MLLLYNPIYIYICILLLCIIHITPLLEQLRELQEARKDPEEEGKTSNDNNNNNNDNLSRQWHHPKQVNSSFTDALLCICPCEGAYDALAF